MTASRGVKVSPSCDLTAGSCDLGGVTAKGDLVPVEPSIPAKAASGTHRRTSRGGFAR